ncbi:MULTISPECIES: pyridoxamine 5'-phosphate oxidase family protein [Corallococcus]|uniref:Pyridoxamine 5'-phosphate oxidase family protein n=1 Tax=Corallococcus caeni TaxID=3082388 RepID=A0ABQ6QME2_9BACT|nr:pyridoxamine 5'-phosphate oxidase family protein [Corallococcus sp. NO1]
MTTTTKTPQDVVEHLGKLIHGIKVAMMTTVDTDGSLRSRPMWTYDKDFDGELWFFTNDHTHKVDEVQKDHHVSLAYSDPTRDRYVSVSGRCALIRDKAKAKELWNPSLKAWFPQGLDDPNLALLRVSVEKAEYWDTPNSKMVQLVGFVKAVLTGEKYHPGDNQKLDRGAPRHN